MKPRLALRSGTLAKLAGISADTLRLYERKGLISAPLRAANGYRCYSHDAVARVRMIRAALSIGFTLDELAKILKLRDAGGAPCHRVRELVAAKLQGLEQHIEQLVALRGQLSEVLRAWDGLLAHTPHGQRAGLLEALAASPQKPRSLPPHVYAAVMKESRR